MIRSGRTVPEEAEIPAQERRAHGTLEAQTALAEISALVARFSGLQYQPLVFPLALEQRFEAETIEWRSKRFWFEGLMVLGLFNLLLLTDYFTNPHTFVRAFVIRTGIVTPLGLIANLVLLRSPSSGPRELGLAGVACLAGLGNLVLQSGHNAVISVYAQFGVAGVILLSNCVLRLRFPYALGTTTLIVIADLVFLAQDLWLDNNQKIVGMLLTIGSAVCTLIANYSSSREERRSYLLCKQGELMLDELTRANSALRIIAERDTLTGLASRHVFNQRFATAWERASRLAKDITIILIDVDHFKRINDTYGHVYGDRVLKRIGHLLAESLRCKDDLAARFGGEEFILLLPDTSQELAMRVANRIRNLVKAAGLPALDSGFPPQSGTCATVSCGVAGIKPQLTDDMQSLIEAADRALYRAKAQGRDRVCDDRSLCLTDLSA